MAAEVLAFGELLWDLLPSGPQLGGAPANFALRAQSVGCSVALVSCVGNDPLGTEALTSLRGLGLDLSYVQVDEQHPTGTVDVRLDNEGNASYIINTNVSYDYITFSSELAAVARSARAVCFGSLVQRSLASRSALYSVLAAAGDAVKIVDINLRKQCYTPDTVRKSLELADILKLNSDEVAPVCDCLGIPELTSEHFCEHMIETFNLSHVLVTRGADGVYAVSKHGENVDLPGFRVHVVDTIGSGDAFTAGFVRCFLNGDSFRHCCDFGNRLGAAVATKKGGMSPCLPNEAWAL